MRLEDITRNTIERWVPDWDTGGAETLPLIAQVGLRQEALCADRGRKNCSETIGIQIFCPPSQNNFQLGLEVKLSNSFTLLQPMEYVTSNDFDAFREVENRYRRRFAPAGTKVHRSFLLVLLTILVRKRPRKTPLPVDYSDVIDFNSLENNREDNRSLIVAYPAADCQSKFFSSVPVIYGLKSNPGIIHRDKFRAYRRQDFALSPTPFLRFNRNTG